MPALHTTKASDRQVYPACCWHASSAEIPSHECGHHAWLQGVLSSRACSSTVPHLMTEKKNASPEALAFVTEVFEKQVPFNRLLDLHVQIDEEAGITVSFNMRDQLIGNFVQHSLHGGVIFSALDVLGGLVAFANLLPGKRRHLTSKDIDLFSRLGTIDMRVDFLRPGQGQQFVATGEALRVGRKVAVTRMDLCNEKGVLIAVATGAYSTGAYTVS